MEPVRAAILSMLAEDPRVFAEETSPAGAGTGPKVFVASLDDSAVTLAVRVWVRKEEYWDVFFAFNERFYEELPARGNMSFPFPQMDVHVQKI